MAMDEGIIAAGPANWFGIHLKSVSIGGEEWSAMNERRFESHYKLALNPDISR